MSAAADKPFNEAEAAGKLEISKSTLIRERLAGKIHPMRHGKRIIYYTDAILDEYRESCRNVSAKSETSGSASGQDRNSGAERGSTKQPDKQSAYLLAQQTFKRAS